MKSRGSLRLVTIVMMGMCVFYGAMAFQMPVETKVVDQSTFLVLSIFAGLGLLGGDSHDSQFDRNHDGFSANIRFAILYRSRCSHWSPRSAPGTGKPRVRIGILGTTWNLICVIGI